MLSRPPRVLPTAVILSLLFLSSCASSPVQERQMLVMDTILRVVAYGRDVEAALEAALTEARRLEALWDRHRQGSEIWRVNRSAGSEPVSVSPETVALLQAALQFAELTGGALDVTIGPVVDLWGFGSGEGRIPPGQLLREALHLVDYRKVRTDAERGTVGLAEEGMSLDLGAVAKGAAVDALWSVLKEAGVRSALVDLGGNIRLLGSPPGRPEWLIGVQDPRDPSRLLGYLRLAGGAVATSGDYQRYFMVGGRRYHHILDPRTGWPAAEVASVTVWAPTALQADALSTALFVLGPERGYEMACSLPGVEALFVLPGGQVKLTPGMQSVFRVNPP